MSEDIDMVDQVYSPIGRKEQPFLGRFDGNNHIIWNLTCSQGLFNAVGYGCSIESVVLRGIHLDSPNTEVGGIVGYCWKGNLRNCFVEGIIKGSSEVGGIVGNCVNSTIDSCFSNVDLKGGYNAGALIGRSINSSITECYSRGIVRVTSNAGGLVGSIEGGTITNCYSIANVNHDLTTPSAYPFGGLVGSNSTAVIKYCFAAGKVGSSLSCGGLVGSGSPEYVVHSYWDIEYSGLTESKGGQGEPTAELFRSLMFTSEEWDMTNTWDIIEGISYPYLRRFPIPTPVENIYFEPANGTQYLNPKDEILLHWKAGSGTISHKIYFGPEIPPPFITEQDDTTYDPGMLEYGKTYYWRIDGSGPGGTTEGAIWSFTMIPWKGDGNDSDPYLIEDAQGLRALSITPGKSNAVFILANDIDMDLTPVPDFVIEKLSGVFNGNNRTISNYKYQSASESTSPVGIFCTLSGRVQDLKLHNITMKGNGSTVGGIVGTISGGNIVNCSIVDAIIEGKESVGGIAGLSNNNIDNCYINNVIIKATGNYVGGICGRNQGGIIKSCLIDNLVINAMDYVGGVSGYNYPGDIQKCTVNGNIYGNNYVGGIAGGQGQISVYIATKFTHITDCSSSGTVSGVGCIGGIAGCSGAGGWITHCHSSANIIGSGEAIGGLVGLVRANSTTRQRITHRMWKIALQVVSYKGIIRLEVWWDIMTDQF